ncbi:hypothetical protein TWF696_008912 [Orbilia brochopaga]|uniref:Uncharacterized protein n=1 Tax=Orbilia brochopaga TaxID=3140254 RepID=A0AAV9UHP1_9PEZI
MPVRRDSQMQITTNPAIAIDDSELGKGILLPNNKTTEQPADLQALVKIPTNESLDAAKDDDVTVDTALGNRGASSDAGANSEADADPGEVVPHRLEDTYPSRPTPIKDQDENAEDPEPASEIAEFENLPEEDGDHTDGYPEHQSDGNSDDEWSNKDEEEMELMELSALPLGMLGPVIDAPGSDAADTGVFEINIGPEMMMAGNGDGMVEEIWISGDEAPTSHGGVFGFGLESLADELEEVMEGLTGTFVKDPAQVSTAAAAATEVARIGEADVEKGWAGLGNVVGIVVAASVLIPLIVIAAAGCCAAFFVAKMRARRRGYREVQEHLNNDEDWS